VNLKLAMAKRRDERPLLWTGLRGKDNIVVLDDEAVYVARLPLKQLPRVNTAFDAGEKPADVLGKHRRVRLDRLIAFEFELSPLHPLATLTLIDRHKGNPRLTTVTFPAAADRDKFKVELQARVGGWPSTERLQHPALAGLKYVLPVAGLVLATGAVTVAEWKGDHIFLGNVTLAVGTLVTLIIGGMGIREVRHPLMTISFAPEANTAADIDPQTEADADHG
jgi:hypothetical protein